MNLLETDSEETTSGIWSLIDEIREKAIAAVQNDRSSLASHKVSDLSEHEHVELLQRQNGYRFVVDGLPHSTVWNPGEQIFDIVSLTP